jgi:nicotinate dehydrogenase subunit B
MPSFAGSLTDRQLAELTAYLRARFASDKPAWPASEAVVNRLRAERLARRRPY